MSGSRHSVLRSTVEQVPRNFGREPKDNRPGSNNMLGNLESDSTPVSMPDFDQLFARLAEVQRDQPADVPESSQFIPPEEDEGAAAVEQPLPAGVWSMGRSCFFRENNELQMRASPKDEGRPKPKPDFRFGRSRVEGRPSATTSAYSSPCRRRTPGSAYRSSSVGRSSYSPGRSPAHRRRSSAAGRYSSAGALDFSDGKRCLNMDYVRTTKLPRCLKQGSKSCSGTPKKMPTRRYYTFEPKVSRMRTSSAPGACIGSDPMEELYIDPCTGAEYYRLRSFSITQDGVYNLGDSYKRKPEPLPPTTTTTTTSTTTTTTTTSTSTTTTTTTSTTTTTTSTTTTTTSTSITTTTSTDEAEEATALVPYTSTTGPSSASSNDEKIPKYSVVMVGDSGVGKSALCHQFMTSNYVCAYVTSDSAERERLKTVHVKLNGQEVELTVVDIPPNEATLGALLDVYRPDTVVVVYSIVSAFSLKVAEDLLMYMWNADIMASSGVILVGNKSDLARTRVVSTSEGRELATSCRCKFIETSSGMVHNVDELLVGILAQSTLNEDRKKNRLREEKRNRFYCGIRYLKSLLTFGARARSCENLLTL